MRGNRGVCLFCRHTLSLRSSPRTPKRFASDSQREPYVLPRLVIDLDAADSKYVRQAEEDELREWHPGSSKRSKTSPRSTPNWKKRSILWRDNRGLSTIQVTPPDLLTFALLGDPTGGWDPKTQYLRHIYRYRKLDPDDGVNAKTLQLTSEFTHNDADRLSLAGFGEGRANEAHITWQMGSPQDHGGFAHVARMISMLSTTKEGCSFLAIRNNIISKAIKLSKETQNEENLRTVVTSEMVLLLLNNLRLSMESKDMYVHEGIASIALYYAARAWNLPAIRKYLEELSGHDLRPHYPQKSLSALVSRLLDEPERAAGPMMQATLQLITGWDGSKDAAVARQRNLSFASLFDRHETSRFSSAYLVGLAELGLKDTLQVEWQADSSTAIKNKFWEDSTNLKAQAFAIAFLLAGDRNRALSILQSAPPDQTEEGISINSLRSTQPPLEQDERVVEEAVDEASEKTNEEDTDEVPESASLRVRALLPLFQRHYSYHNVYPKGHLRRTLLRTLDHLPTDPEQVLNIFEMFLIRNYRAPHSYDSADMKRVHWFDDGAEGLVVMPEEGDTPLYWKPARAEAEAATQADV